MYVKDLTGITNGKELLASSGKRAQWSVKRAQSMGVHVREIGPDEFDVFADIERRTGERRGFATPWRGLFPASSSRRMAQMRISCSRKSTSPNMWRI